LQSENLDGMFSIGLFSTYLPYILIAMFYGAYVGIHSIVKAELQDDPDTEIAAKQINADSSSQDQHSEKRTYHYDNHVSPAEPDQPPQQEYFTAQTIYTGGKPAIPRSRYCTTLFCRPPPVA
jgi:hypothetical protein